MPTGPQAIADALSNLDLDKLEAEQHAVIASKKTSKRDHAVKVLNVLEGLKRNQLKPKDFMISNVPVIPPAFRPFSVAGSTFVPGDANELYRDLMNLRDAHVEHVQTFGAAAADKTREALYDSVKALYGYGDPVTPKSRQRGLSGYLKTVTGTSPKFSMVQSKLLAKPQDNVARGVIVPDPDLDMDQIGVPKDMAWTMYAPYIQGRLVRHHAMAPGDALKHVHDRTDIALHALKQEMKSRPVMYSRAPAWHRFNFLAANPVMIEGDSIKVSPLTTTGYSGDFDGDQMNLHVPSSPGAVKDAYEKLMPSKMLWSIRDPEKIVPAPKHEQVWGAFASTQRPGKSYVFSSRQQALEAIQRGDVKLEDNVEIK